MTDDPAGCQALTGAPDARVARAQRPGEGLRVRVDAVPAKSGHAAPSRRLDVGRYLRRIGTGPVSDVDRATLARLQRAHLLAVPFENLDIRAGRPLALDEEALFDKIVVRRRGGICYEQNLLFAAVLRATGFEVALLSAEVARDDGSFGPPFDHLALLVTLADRRLLADVGFGDSFLEPLDLDQRGQQPQGTACWEVRLDGPWHVVMGRGPAPCAAWTPAFRLQGVAREAHEFDAMSLYHQTSPDSHFTRKDVCSRATPGGRLTLGTRQLIETCGPTKTHTDLRDEAHRQRILQERFGIFP